MSRAATIAVAVVVRHDCVLVGRRAADALDAAGLHEFPGGKVEADESPETAAERECLEETGIAVRVRRRIGEATAAAASGPLTILFFEAAPVDARDEPLVPFTWTPIAELPRLSFPAANAGVVALLLQGGS